MNGFCESFKDLILPLSGRRAVITLLPKKGDLQEITNWRPVSLLCTDYKMLSKTLANRLREVIPCRKNLYKHIGFNIGFE